LSSDGAPVLFVQGVGGVIGECWRPQVSNLESSFWTLISAAIHDDTDERLLRS